MSLVFSTAVLLSATPAIAQPAGDMGTGPLGPTNVPEPGSAIALLLGAGAISSRRRWQG